MVTKFVTQFGMKPGLKRKLEMKNISNQKGLETFGVRLSDINQVAPSFSLRNEAPSAVRVSSYKVFVFRLCRMLNALAEDDKPSLSVFQPSALSHKVTL